MLSEITLGQYFPGNSFIHHLDPRTKLLGTIIYIVALFLAKTALAYGIVVGFGFFVLFVSRLPVLMVLKSLKPVIFILVITLIIHALSYPGQEIVWQWKIFSVTREGLDEGLKMTVRLIMLLLFSSVLTFTTSPLMLTDGIEKLLRPFKKIGVPSHEIAMMMTIALRFIPTLLEETDRIMKAQTARGADFGKGGLWGRVMNMFALMVPLFVSAFRRAEELAVAMEARCYHGGEGRTRMYELHYHNADFVAYIVMLVLVLVVILTKEVQL